MKFCTKCGQQISDESVFCPKCGCATDNATAEQLDNHTVIKTSTTQLLGVCMLGGLIFGAIIGILFSMLDIPFITTFLISGGLFSFLMFGGMFATLKLLNNTARKNILKKVASSGKIYLEGAANRAGNGGWLFVTQNGIEHHPHNTNLDSSPTVISHSDIISIYKNGKKLSIKTTAKNYNFVVNSIDQWITLLSKFELTKNKIL